jgi:hypothetical protein
MPPIPLTVLQAVAPASSVLLRAGEGTVVFDGDYTGPAYTCGSCGAVLIDGARGEHLVDLVLSCNACGAWNASPVADIAHILPGEVEPPVAFPPGTYELTAPITVHDGWVMASAAALAGGTLGVAAPYRPAGPPPVDAGEEE